MNTRSIEKGVVMKILVVDDEPTVRELVIAMLEKLNGVEFLEASSYKEAVQILEGGGVGCFVTDKSMPPLRDAGLQLLQRGKELGIPGLLLSGDTPVVEALVKRGVPAFEKLVSSSVLVEAVKKLMESAQAPSH